MAKDTVRFENVTATTRDNVTGDLEFVVNRYRKSVYGTCLSASITAYGGTRNQRYLLTHLLGKGVVITTGGTKRDNWWGYIDEIVVNDGFIQYKVSMKYFANKVCVAYSYLGERGTTDWASDTKSISTYGTWELIVSAADTSPDSADTRRDTELALRKYPIPVVDILSGGGGASVEIKCKGWFETLKRRYWIQEEGYEGYTDSGTGDTPMGDNNIQEVAQQFYVSSSTGWDLKKVDIRIRTEESPTDNVEVELRTGATIAGSSLVATTGTVAYTDIEDSMNWVTFEFATAQTLSTSTSYWIVVQRTGAQDATNHYIIDGNEEVGYVVGANACDGYYYNGSWSAFDPAMDLNFRLYGEKETTEQINDILTDTVYFLATPAIDIKDSSGVYSNQYKEDYVIAYDEIIKLLEMGDSANNRLLVDVGLGRAVVVKTDENAKTFTLTRKGELFDRTISSLVEPALCMFGCWVELSDAIPDTAYTGLSFVSQTFIDEAEYSGGRWKPTKTKGHKSVFDIIGGDLLG